MMVEVVRPVAQTFELLILLFSKNEAFLHHNIPAADFVPLYPVLKQRPDCSILQFV
jgi:hypothetical protein